MVPDELGATVDTRVGTSLLVVPAVGRMVPGRPVNVSMLTETSFGSAVVFEAGALVVVGCSVGNSDTRPVAGSLGVVDGTGLEVDPVGLSLITAARVLGEAVELEDE